MTASRGVENRNRNERSGFVNAHTHIYSGLAPLGMPPPAEPPANFIQILERVWWRLDRALDEKSLAAAARYYAARALLSGTTTLIDHHESPEFIDGSLDVLADACQELGIRAILCFGATERNGGRREARQGLAECRRFITTNERPLVRGLVGLHASFTVSDETIAEAAGLCRELDRPLHVHVAEDTCDVSDARARGFDGPFERLLAFHALPAGSIMAHGVHLGAHQVRQASASGVWLVQNPRSNRGNKVGYPPALAQGTRVALGTDGWPSDLPAELETLFEEAGRHGDDRDAAAARLGAGLELAGTVFRPGGSSPSTDRIIVEAGQVVDVTVAGRKVVSGGRLVTADLEEIDGRAREEAPRLWERMQALPPA